jgi:hypothetical protein
VSPLTFGWEQSSFVPSSKDHIVDSPYRFRAGHPRKRRESNGMKQVPSLGLRSRPLHLHVVKPGNPSSMEPSQRRNGKHAEHHCYDNQRCLSSTISEFKNKAWHSNKHTSSKENYSTSIIRGKMESSESMKVGRQIILDLKGPELFVVRVRNSDGTFRSLQNVCVPLRKF